MKTFKKGQDDREPGKQQVRVIDGNEGPFAKVFVIDTRWGKLRAAERFFLPLMTLSGMTAASFADASFWVVVAIGIAGFGFSCVVSKRR